MAVDVAQIIPPLVRAKVDFILIGGMAAICTVLRESLSMSISFIHARAKTSSASPPHWPHMTRISEMPHQTCHSGGMLRGPAAA
jgi:hypothetical protein